MLEVEELEEVIVVDKESNKITLFNDDFNSFQHVIQCLRVYVGYKYDDALESAKRVHFQGLDVIMEGDNDKLEPVYSNLVNEGLTVSLS